MTIHMPAGAGEGRPVRLPDGPGAHTTAGTGRPPSMNYAMPAKPRRAWRVLHFVLPIATLFIGMAIGAGTAGPSSAPQTAAPAAAVSGQGTPAVVPPTAATAARTPVKATGPKTSFGDGTWEIGRDIAAGTYSTTVPADSFGCYWETDKDANGTLDSIVANDNVVAGGRAVVVANGKAKWLKVNGCGTWSRR